MTAVTFAKEGASVPFETLAAGAERVRGTAKKLEKMAALAEYFTALGDNDLAITARSIAGQLFPQHDMRVLQVGGAAIVQTLVTLSGLTREETAPLSVHLGELGEVPRVILPGHLPETSTLTLAAVEAAVEELAVTAGAKAKTALLTALLRRATPLEAAYLVKLVSGDLRIGLKQGLVEDALARGFGRPLAAVSHAAMLLGDLGEAATPSASRASSACGTTSRWRRSIPSPARAPSPRDSGVRVRIKRITETIIAKAKPRRSVAR